MSGKGSKQRPMNIQYDLFESNWDRVFGKKQEQLELPLNNTLREVNYDNMWKHSCTVEMGVMWIGKEETCNYCGAWEEDGL